MKVNKINKNGIYRINGDVLFNGYGNEKRQKKIINAITKKITHIEGNVVHSNWLGKEYNEIWFLSANNYDFVVLSDKPKRIGGILWQVVDIPKGTEKILCLLS